MRPDNRWEDVDKAALSDALLALGTCPNCRDDLRPVATLGDVYGCANCAETWHLPNQSRAAAPPIRAEEAV